MSCLDFDDPICQKYWRLHILGQELEPAWVEFRDRVYQGGLAEKIDKSTRNGMSGKFNDITLRSFDMCGRVMLTFEGARGQVTYLGCDLLNERYDDKQRPLGESFGIHSIEGDVFDALRSITTVTAFWPLQRNNYRDDDGTTLDVIAAINAGEGTDE